MDNLNLSKKERREAKRLEKMSLRTKIDHKKTAITLLKWSLGLSILSFFVWFVVNSPKVDQNDYIAKDGLHWHADLKIIAQGKEISIPKDIGIGAVHNPIHTHDNDDVVHMEFSGPVRRDDLKLGRFFKVWGKDFMSFGSGVSMSVNENTNADLQEYMMQDKDQIELIYN